MKKIERFNDPQEMAKAAADIIVKISAASIKERNRFSIALSGGNTPAILYALLAQQPYRDKIDWQRIFIFWGDERCVPANSKDNNSHNAKRDLLDHVPLPPENIFPVPVELTPEMAAAEYDQTLKDFFKDQLPQFDLILLGMGDNGHTASLFPHTNILHDTGALVKEVFVEEVNMWRISFTAPLINHAAHILFLVAGKEKEHMLKTVLDGPYRPDDYPAQLIRNATWLIGFKI